MVTLQTRSSPNARVSSMGRWVQAPEKIKIWKNSQNQYDVDWLILKLDNLLVKVPQQEQWVLLCNCCQCSTCLHQIPTHTEKVSKTRHRWRIFKKDWDGLRLRKIPYLFLGVDWYRMDWIALDIFQVNKADCQIKEMKGGGCGCSSPASYPLIK